MRQQRFFSTLWQDAASRWVAGIAILIIVAGIVAYWLLRPLQLEQTERLVELVITAIGIESLILIVAQGRATIVWNRLFAYHKFFQDRPPEHRIDALQKMAVELGCMNCIKGVEPLPKTAIPAILNNREHLFTVSKYLDDFEVLCGAINARIVDPEYAYHLEGTRVIRAFVMFDPLICELRKENKYSRCYLELQRLGAQWKKRREEEEASDNHRKGVPAST